MRLIDPRPGAAGAVAVEAWASPAAELLRAMATLASDEPRAYDIGTDRIRSLRGSMSPGLRWELDRFAGSDDREIIKLVGLLAWLEEPGEVDDLLALLDTAPVRVWHLQLADAIEDWPEVSDPLARRVAHGDADAVHELRATAQDAPNPPAALTSLLGDDPGRAGRQLATLARRFRDELWTDLEVEALEAIHQEVLHRRAQADEGYSPARLVLDATNGYELEEDERLDRVLLLPSFWMRPWIAAVGVGGVQVICSPVADDFLALPSEDPPPALLKLVKALSDEGRLRLLRRMSSGPIRLSDAVDITGVTKATAHHHLSMLRQAGLVSLRGKGRATRYGLRTDPPEAARDGLEAYLAARSGER